MILLLGIVLLGKNVESYNDITSREGLCNNRQKMLTLIMISHPERASVIRQKKLTLIMISHPERVSVITDKKC